MRLNQYLARAGVAARRKADALIAAGRVTVNGQLATPGRQVDPEVDQVHVDGRRLALPDVKTYVVLNKPAGVLTSVGDSRGRPTVIDQLSANRRLFPVGRLDLESRGLIVLTDDGELAMRLMHPRYQVEKEYRVTVGGRPDASAMERLSQGMEIKGERFQPAEVRVLSCTSDTTRLSMILREGRKREIRRLWSALGHPVVDLQRVRIDGLDLGNLKEGHWRRLTEEEVGRLKAAVS